jgi:tetratricopeptide (TPR) repeat protein
MSDETLDPSMPAALRDRRPADRDEPAPEEVGTIADAEDQPRIDDVPQTLVGTCVGTAPVAEADPLESRRADPGAAADVGTQADLVPAGAFDQTEAATGISGPPNHGNHGTLLAETLVGTQVPTGADAWTDEDFDRLKRRCGHYLLKQFYAKGGMGEVWLAEDPVIGRSVALKRMLSKDSQHATRFRVEAQVTGKLEHPGIVPVHELGTNAQGEPYYVMKFVQGRTLSKVIKEFHAKELPAGAHEVELVKLLQMFVSLCQTVAYAHSRGVIHRDLKPDNVMLGPYGETILLDWGIAKVLGQTAPTMGDASSPSAPLMKTIPDTGTHDGAIMGTPSYMAPEVAAGKNDEVDERSDIYLLGATLYQILSGQQPRTAKTLMEMIYKATQESPDPVRSINPLIPAALDAICVKAMAREKLDRYQTATELAEDIQRFVAGEPVSAYREGFPARAWRWARRHRKALGLSAAAVLIGSSALFAAIKIAAAERRHAAAAREAGRLKAQEQAQADLRTFRHLADEASYFAATTNPTSEHAPYFDPHKGGAMARAALALAEAWGPDLAALPLPAERPTVKAELYDLLILAASQTLRAEPGPAGAMRALASLTRAASLGEPSASVFRLKAGAYEQLGHESEAAEMRRRADDPKTPRTASDLFLLGERERDESAARVGGQGDIKSWQLDPARMEKAIAFYRQALRIDPDHFWARLQLGRCLQNLGRFPEAAEVLGACIAIRPGAPWGYSALGLALAEQGHYDEAAHELNRALRIDPDARGPRLHRGIVSWRQKKYDAAIADFEAVLAPPDDARLVEAAYYRGQLHLERGAVPEALDDFNRVIAATPRFRSVYLDRPLIFFAGGDVPRALADLDSYVSLVRKVDPKSWEVPGLRGRLLRFLYSELPQEKRRGPTGQTVLKTALAELSRAVQMGGNEAGLFDDLGAVLEHAGRLDQAILAYSRGVALAPDFAKLRIKRGWAWEQLNQHDKASADFVAAARSSPENAEAHTGLGYIQALRKLPPDAQTQANLALLHGGDDYLVLHNVACIYAALSQSDDTRAGDYQDVSIALLRRALDLWRKADAGPNELELIKAEPAFKPLQGRKDLQDLLRAG